MAAMQVYEIRVEGRLGPEWSAWFGGMAIEGRPGGGTLIAGALADQAALHGILARIRDLGLPLVSVRRLESASEARTMEEGRLSRCVSMS